MCFLRRVFYSCLHEDTDVTPPRAIAYCRKAVPNIGDSGSASRGGVKPCAYALALPLTARGDVHASIVRSEPCEVCAMLRDAEARWRELGEGMMVTTPSSYYALPRPEEDEGGVVDDSELDIDALLQRLDEAAREDQRRDQEAALFDDDDDDDWDGDAQYLTGLAGIEPASGCVANGFAFETAGCNEVYELCEGIDPDAKALPSITTQIFEYYDDIDDAEFEKDFAF
ncbi:hypothetical protein F5B19DRAFT_420410 [Rostrohypoxylon terebratum]|nr:hypothetical protein F5B19DRAFT_420410 [Rostrohypoxylon terebratum]